MAPLIGPWRSRRVTLREAALPFGSLVAMVAVLFALPPLEGESLSLNNGYDIFQSLAANGAMALAMGISMVAGEFDFSVPANFLLASVIAIKLGGGSWIVGLLAAVGIATIVGLVQGAIVAKMHVNSASVTLGGFLLLNGLVYAVTHSEGISYKNATFGSSFDTSWLLSVFSTRTLIVGGMFAVAGAAMKFTRLGPDVRAVGGDRQAALTAGVGVDHTVIGVFVASATISALGGAFQGYAFSYATPGVSLNALIFAITAALIGGVNLRGGQGTIIGIAAGVLALSCLDELLTVLGVGDDVNQLVTGGLLCVVALVSAPGLTKGWKAYRARTMSSDSAALAVGQAGRADQRS